MNCQRASARNKNKYSSEYREKEREREREQYTCIKIIVYLLMYLKNEQPLFERKAEKERVLLPYYLVV